MTLRTLAVGLLLVSGAAVADNHASDDGQSDLSYMLGYDVGTRLGEMEVELLYDRFMEGLRAGATGEETALSEARLEEVRATFNAMQQEVMARRQEEMRLELAAASEKNKEEGEAFLAENAKRDGVIVTESGLQYEVVEMAEGPMPAPEATVTVHYTGRLIDGTVFDSSVERGAPATFGLNRVISGWTEGLQLMPVGSKFKFFIPSDLAYGGRRAGELIGPNSTLIFDVELIDIAGE